MYGRAGPSRVGYFGCSPLYYLNCLLIQNIVGTPNIGLPYSKVGRTSDLYNIGSVWMEIFSKDFLIRPSKRFALDTVCVECEWKFSLLSIITVTPKSLISWTLSKGVPFKV